MKAKETFSQFSRNLVGLQRLLKKDLQLAGVKLGQRREGNRGGEHILIVALTNALNSSQL